MITPYKGREVRPGDLVKIRWNLRTGGWSIMATNGTMRDRVVAHADKVQLADVEFRVSEAQRQRALKTGQRNAHAFAVGILLDPSDHPSSDDAHRTSTTRASYRYERSGTFVTANYEDAVYHAAYADFGLDGQMFVGSD
ncbi:MAG TPA: hypothetical protein VI029_13550 [Mycobacterium sp.]